MMKTDMAKRLGLYLHIPFCIGKCRYCDFYSGVFDERTREAYVDALCAQLSLPAEAARGYTVDTVYFGGGTPTVMDGADFQRIMDTVRAHYMLARDAEITTECNPATLDERGATALLEAGLNRISIGAQSLSDAELSVLGRRHTKQDFLDTVKAVKAAGFQNISADLMFGIPMQTLSSFERTLDEMIALDLSHISAYGLRIEEGTPFFEKRESLPLPTEDDEVEMQQMVVTKLKNAGFLHYEISNYAREGFACRHNLGYWRCEPYLGFGPGAHSFFENERYDILPDIGAYLRASREHFSGVVRNRQIIGGKEAMDEYVMLQMRLSTGVDHRAFAARYGCEFSHVYGDLRKYEQGGFLTVTEKSTAFTEKGFFVSNAILSELLDFGK